MIHVQQGSGYNLFAQLLAR